ncbi:hypothetical protein Q0N88_32450 [Bacillus thuringiensis]|uniref:hypothetical protein n=1 Tax=Bacillus thuringiensis TaxID=1428 RepID=UPI0034598F9D
MIESQYSFSQINTVRHIFTSFNHSTYRIPNETAHSKRNSYTRKKGARLVEKNVSEVPITL